MPDDTLPKVPPPGMVRYKAVCRDPAINPFQTSRFMAERGIPEFVQTVDLDEKIPFNEVEKMARAAQGKYEFVRLEIVS